jgi:hypothetical protein
MVKVSKSRRTYPLCGDRRFGALEQAQAQLVGQLTQLGRTGIEPLAHPHAAGHLGKPERLLEEAIAAKRLDRLEVSLAQRINPNMLLNRPGSSCRSIQNRCPRIHQRGFAACRSATTRIGGQLALGFFR